jgi:hypothetical protein
MQRRLLILLAAIQLAYDPESCVAEGSAELLARAKRATALVEIRTGETRGFGTAFCVDRSGLFVTNAHVVDDAAEDGSVKLVMNIGQKDQRVTRARVVRSNRDQDLSILKVDPNPVLVALELGQDNELVETAEVTVLGFPLGDTLALRPDGYPDISVNTSRITALRKAEGKLALVQVDGLLNPGNSGGPVLDRAGRVIGVVAAGVLGRGINFAIPIGRLGEQLEAPLIVFNPPALVYSTRSQLVDWKIQLKPALRNPRPLSKDLRVSATLLVTGRPPQLVTAKPMGDGMFRASLRPVQNDPGRVLFLLVTIGGQTERVVIPDQALRINKQRGMLSELRMIVADAPPPRALTAGGNWIPGSITGLGRMKLRSGKEIITVDLSKATRIVVEAMTVAPVVREVEVEIEVKQGAATVATEHRRLALKGAPAALPGE